MGYIWAIYYLYLFTYLLLPFPVGYPGTRRITRRDPGNKLPGYGSPTASEWSRQGKERGKTGGRYRGGRGTRDGRVKEEGWEKGDGQEGKRKVREGICWHRGHL